MGEGGGQGGRPREKKLCSTNIWREKMWVGIFGWARIKNIHFSP